MAQWKIVGAKILLKLLDYGVYIFTFTLVSSMAAIVYVEVHYGNSIWMIMALSFSIFFVMVFLGWLLPAFGDTTYWDSQYAKGGQDEVIEWYGVSYLDVRLIIRRIMTVKTDSILHVGCGNSTFPSDLWDAGYRNCTSIDVSSVVLQQMSKRYERKHELQWLCMDATNMSFDDSTFQCIIDKGTLDAVLCTNNPDFWVKAYMKDVYRVLKDGGTFMLITGYDPKDMMKSFSKHPWSVEHRTVAGRDGNSAHLYLATKDESHIDETLSSSNDYDFNSSNDLDSSIEDEMTGLMSGARKRSAAVNPV